MFGALHTDLSKAFDFLAHAIIIAKSYPYGFDMKAPDFIYDYLRNRKQRTKIDNACSSWEKNTTWISSRIDFGTLII